MHYSLEVKKMSLKNVRLARAENLTPSIREKHKLPEKGLIVIESLNPDLHENFQHLTDITEYLLKYGDFSDEEIDES